MGWANSESGRNRRLETTSWLLEQRIHGSPDSCSAIEAASVRTGRLKLISLFWEATGCRRSFDCIRAFISSPRRQQVLPTPCLVEWAIDVDYPKILENLQEYPKLL